ncbi:multiprotein-bridging factor 1 family protein [Actinomadura sp. NTSP31]|uniref:helix-turn-helix domain-containing protein n=1 Tax=Actinomadura sp. NTSP31 TaxID=1735447 RepID=UPI0035C00DC5
MNINEPPDPRSSMWAWIAYSLRFHRMQRGLTGDAMAKLLKCSCSSISRLENGEAKLDEKQAATLDAAWNTGGHFTLLSSMPGKVMIPVGSRPSRASKAEHH